MTRPDLFIGALFGALLGAAPAAAEPHTYAIDNSHTYPTFSYNHLGFSNQVHRFTTTSGEIVLDLQARTGSVAVTIDATSVDTGFAVFDGHIQGEDFFHTAEFPTITFRADAIEFEGDTPVAVPGELTIKGVTRPVTLQLTSFVCMEHPLLKKPACGANAEAVVKRSDFNMDKYVPAVSDEVTLTIPVEAIRQ